MSQQLIFSVNLHSLFFKCSITNVVQSNLVLILHVEIKDIPRVKKIAAVHLSHAWNTIPHVTNHDEADVTDMENFRNSLKDLHTGEKKKINLVIDDNMMASFNEKGVKEIEPGNFKIFVGGS